MSDAKIEIGFSEETLALMRDEPDSVRMLGATARGIDTANQRVVADISARRMTGKGPYPVAEGKLGVVTNRLRSSLRNSKATIDGNVITGTIGSNVRYAGIHEFGGVIDRTTKAGSVRLRTDRQGNLIRQGVKNHLAMFARKSHKLVREVKYRGGKSYQIRIPARAPIGHGIADNTQTYDTEIRAQLREMWRRRR